MNTNARDDLPHPLPDELVEKIAERFRCIAEPMRLKLLDVLRDGEATVQELADRVGASQQNASKHLAILHHGGVVARRKDGTRIWYCVEDESVYRLCEEVCGGMRKQLDNERNQI
jgi:DNA-binding transcriptional ArsR family regulator